MENFNIKFNAMLQLTEHEIQILTTRLLMRIEIELATHLLNTPLYARDQARKSFVEGAKVMISEVCSASKSIDETLQAKQN